MEVRAEGFRVLIRTLLLDDSTAIAGNANDREICLNIVGPGGAFPYPYTLADAMSFIENSSNAALSGTMFNFAVCLEGTGELIGACGVSAIDHAAKRCEIGYWIGRRHWGNGLGKEAVRLLLHFAFAVLGMGLAYARVLRSNARSVMLLRSLGFAEEEREQGTKGSELVMSLARARSPPITASVVM